jgi:hypothetical protein
VQTQDLLQRRIPPVFLWALAILALTLAGRWLQGRQLGSDLFDDIAFYLADPRLQRIRENYEECPPMGPLRLFVLRADDSPHQ